MERMAYPVCKKGFSGVPRIPLERVEIATKRPHCGKISILEISNKNKKKPYRVKK